MVCPQTHFLLLLLVVSRYPYVPPHRDKRAEPQPVHQPTPCSPPVGRCSWPPPGTVDELQVLGHLVEGQPTTLPCPASRTFGSFKVTVSKSWLDARRHVPDT